MYSGIIIVNKEQGFTSHDVVAKLRGILKQKKIGHTGTLDPDATGVLPVCLGSATKLCDMLTDKDKTYEAVMILGKVTDTQDMSGNVISEDDVLSKREKGSLSDCKILESIESFVGDYDQVPPMYSALKVNGKKLYELAREGVEIERKARPVKIISISNISIDFPRVRMTVECSKGTYIRTLCHDIGGRLGCGAAMESLKRTKVGVFEISDALTMGEISDAASGKVIDDKIITVEEIFKNYVGVATISSFDKLLHNGNPVSVHMLQKKEALPAEGGRVRMYDSKGQFIGIFVYSPDSRLIKCEKMFMDN